MFEEVPRGRRGLAGLSARRIVLGPFAIGGGVLLATVGGSVAVAATVITASSIHTSIHTNDLPPKSGQQPLIISTQPPASHSGTPSRSAALASSSAASGGPASTSLTLAGAQPSASLDPSRGAASLSRNPGGSLASPSGSATPTGTTGGSSGPIGNALIYISGYDQTSHRLSFEFASVQRGAGPSGSDLYTVSSPERFSATIAASITITSGGQLCPPAGSSCTVAQLVAAAANGFYANAAIDPAGAVHSILELDNVQSSPAGSSTPAAPQPSAALTSSPQPSPSATE